MPSVHREFATQDQPKPLRERKKGISWTNEEKSLLAQSLRNGKSLKDIYEEILPHRTYRGIAQVAARSRVGNPWKLGDTQKLARLLATNRIIQEIQEEHFPEYSYISIKSRLKRLRAQNAKELPRREIGISLTGAEQQTLHTLHTHGATIKELAAALRRPYSTIQTCLHRLELAVPADQRLLVVSFGRRMRTL